MKYCKHCGAQVRDEAIFVRAAVVRQSLSRPQRAMKRVRDLESRLRFS